MERRNAGLAALSSLDDPVRRRLYDFVAGQREPSGRDEAAAAAGIGRPLAAYHLDKLVDLGLLTASYQRPPGRGGPGAGRPAKRYARSAAEFTVTLPPREYELAARLLAAAIDADPGGACHPALRAAARQYGAGLGARASESARGSSPESPAADQPRRAADGSAPDRAVPDGAVPDGAVPDGAMTGLADRALAVLSAHGYEPQPGDDGVIRLRNCPFRQLADDHRDLVCGMSLALIDGLVAGLGGGARLRPALAPEPGHCCVIIGPGPEAGAPAPAPAPADRS
jgi:predicted ArsR family transcriptional regulator